MNAEKRGSVGVGVACGHYPRRITLPVKGNATVHLRKSAAKKITE